jgi:uncharacterized protein (TIGR02217 family)
MTDLSFHDVLFPVDISYGSNGGPGFNTTIKELASGHEQRNINWSEARARYDAKFGIKTVAQMTALVDFFFARNGKAYGFRYLDPVDNSITNQWIATGDGALATYQIFKRYEPLTAYFYDRIIRKPVAGSLQMQVDGIDRGSTLHPDGTVTMDAAPAAGKAVTVKTLNFHVPVRFDIDALDVSYDEYNNLSVPSIPIIELRPR